MVVVSKQICRAVPPFAVVLSEFRECGPTTRIHERGGSIDKIFDPFGLRGWWWTFLGVR
jgi:hypothetical protein